MGAGIIKDQGGGIIGAETFCYQQRDEESEQERKFDDKRNAEIKNRCRFSWKKHGDYDCDQKSSFIRL